MKVLRNRTANSWSLKVARGSVSLAFMVRCLLHSVCVPVDSTKIQLGSIVSVSRACWTHSIGPRS